MTDFSIFSSLVFSNSENTSVLHGKEILVAETRNWHGRLKQEFYITDVTIAGGETERRTDFGGRKTRQEAAIILAHFESACIAGGQSIHMISEYPRYTTMGFHF